jgi:solute:Na+ symporter, SSS family
MTSLFILVYLCGALIVGLASSARKDRSVEDYFYGGKAAGPIAIGSTLVLGNLVRYQIVVLALSGSMYLWVGLTLSVIVVVLSYVYRFPRSTSVDSQELWGNRRTQLAVQGVTVLISVVAQIAVLLVLANVLLGAGAGIDGSIALLVMAVFAGVYTLVGGFSAVAATQVFQMGVFLVGLVILCVQGGSPGMQGGFGMHALGIETPSAWGILGLPVLSLWFWHYDFFPMQQSQAVREHGTLRRGLIVAGILGVGIGVLMALASPGAFGAATGIVWQVFVLAVFALIMASLSSSFMGAAGLLSQGVLRNIRPWAAEQGVVLVGRLIVAGVVAITILMIPLAESAGPQILSIYLLLLTTLIPPITAVYAVRLVSRSVPSGSVVPGLVVGGIFGIARIALVALASAGIALPPELSWVLGIDQFAFAFCSFGATLLVLYAAATVVALRLRTADRPTSLT